ncbi:MAG TPA: dTMP kinase [Bdellovibrionota bacterium]|jgi:dTMP kinase|nr:dTMP kinase [Bdellovibrionota bacterium]
MPRQRGRFITFEGTEGAGKSTLMTKVRERLEARGLTPVVTREPGGSPLAERLRELILGQAMAPTAELFLYEASRAEHLDKTVLPALDEGRWVLCDRFTDSSLAYQGGARGLPWKDVKAANRLATGGLDPDLTVFLDVDPEVGLKRTTDPNRFEREGLEFHQKVRKGFARAGREAGRRWLKLKVAGATPEGLADKVLSELEKRRWLARA